MPGMKVTGTKTASSTSVVAMIGAVIWVIAWRVASLGSNPSAISSSTFSTTTIASSTTMPMARTNANSVTVLRDIPSARSTPKVPISETGIATTGIRVARRLPRNTKTTRTTSAKVSISVWITSLSELLTKPVVLNGMAYSTPSGNRPVRFSSSAITPSETASAFAPGDW